MGLLTRQVHTAQDPSQAVRVYGLAERLGHPDRKSLGGPGANAIPVRVRPLADRIRKARRIRPAQPVQRMGDRIGPRRRPSVAAPPGPTPQCRGAHLIRHLECSWHAAPHIVWRNRLTLPNLGIPLIESRHASGGLRSRPMIPGRRRRSQPAYGLCPVSRRGLGGLREGGQSGVVAAQVIGQPLGDVGEKGLADVVPALVALF